MKRTLPGILLAVCWVLLLVKGAHSLFYFVMVAISAIGANEYLQMVFPGKIDFFSRVYFIAALCLPVIFTAPALAAVTLQFGLFCSFFMVTLYFIRQYAHFENSYDFFSRMVFGVVYVGVLSAYLVQLRYLPQGGSWLVVLSAVTAGSDSGAYYFGSTFGRRKLCPNISPKKTIEGAIGGLCCGVVMAIICSVLLLEQVNYLFIVLSAILLTGVGIIGDLTESIVKRGTGTKDSGRLLAGHGGILDRIDSLLLASPVLFYLLLFSGVK